MFDMFCSTNFLFLISFGHDITMFTSLDGKAKPVYVEPYILKSTR